MAVATLGRNVRFAGVIAAAVGEYFIGQRRELSLVFCGGFFRAVGAQVYAFVDYTSDGRVVLRAMHPVD